MIHTSLKIGNFTVHNRLVMPPMQSNFAEQGLVGSGTLDFYRSRAKSGKIGLVVTEHCFINRQGMANAMQLSMAEDKCIEGFQRLTDTIHECGSRTIAQINHVGSAAKSAITGMDVLAPSALPHGRKNDAMPRPMTSDDIKRVVEDFAKAALRSKKAGYDGVEIHSCHGYLLNQFYSPLLNRREDEYGGCVGNRIRLHLEVIDAVRGLCGEDYPVAVRLGGCDYMQGGTVFEDSIVAVQAFEKAGVSLIDLSGGLCGTSLPMRRGPVFRDMAEAIKPHVSVPMIMTGGITDGETANMLLEEGCADLIGVGRALLRDADWAEKNI